MFELGDECKIIFKNYYLLTKYVLGCHLGWTDGMRFSRN